MKSFVLALVALVAGGLAGYYLTKREFAADPYMADLHLTSLDKRRGEKIGPRVEVVNGERYKFGTMDRHAKNSHEFILRNLGDEPLSLLKGATTCKCTLSSFDNGSSNSITIPPGGKAPIKLEWNARTSESIFEQSAEIRTNDKRRPTIHLSVYGEVIDTLRPEAYEIHFSDISSNEPASATTRIFAYRLDSLEIEKFELTNKALAEFFQISFAPLNAEEVQEEPRAKSGVRMTVELKAGLPMGPIDQTIRLFTNVPDAEPLELRVVGDVASDVVLTGGKVTSDRSIVSLGTVKSSAGMTHNVFVVVKGPYRDEVQLNITEIEPEGALTATLGEPLRGNPRVVRYPLKIEVPDGATPVSRLSPGSYAKIKIVTTHPDVPELVVSVRYAVTED